MKADEAPLSMSRRSSVNEWFDSVLSTRLNSHERGAIILVMQRLHADDLVAHVLKKEAWDVGVVPGGSRRRY